MRFGSVCSGIEAASVAWHPLGWRASWLAEIEAFPSAVLAHRFPDVTNLGDMTTIADRVRAGEVEAPDVLVGGTPCQAFSVAGLRGGLSDSRGALTLSYVELADAIDDIRSDRSEQPAIIVWENVPGVLSSKDNAFGCFLGALAGEECELQPTGKRWPDAGCVYGPQRAIAWRILDAQHFGLAQRRRRVFVVASARDGFDPAAVLFEFDGLRRDSAPSREAGEDVAGTLAGGARKRGGQSLDDVALVGTLRGSDGGADVDHGCAGHLLPGCWWDGGQLSQTLDAVLHKGQTMPEKNRFPAVLQPIPILEPGKRTGVSTTDKRAGLGIGNPGDPMFTLQAGAQHGVCVTGDITHTLKADGHDGSEDGTGRGTPIIAFPEFLSGTAHASTENLSPSLGAKNPTAVALSVALRGREGGATAELGDDIGNCLRASSGGGDKPHVLTAMQVRRLTPIECERLQGFPDNWTLVPDWYACSCGHHFPEALGKYGCPNCCGDGKARLKRTADGPRYKSLGNSMAVPCMAWIGRRIAAKVAA